jgi:hypothetical protein
VSNTAVTIYGVVAVTFMMSMYGLERRGATFVALFAVGCVLSSGYGFLAGTWPFGVVELVWSALALRRWHSLRRGPDRDSTGGRASDAAL